MTALSGIPIAVDVMVGPATASEHHTAVADLPVKLATNDVTGYNIYHDPPEAPRIMAMATIAVVTFGMTSLELACLGIPQICLALTDDHLQSARLLEERGVAMTLCKIKDADAGMVRVAALMLLEAEGRRR